MAYLEGIKAVHNDLRAANVLVAEDHSVKVSDFELAKLSNSDNYRELQFTSLNDLCGYIFVSFVFIKHYQQLLHTLSVGLLQKN